MQSLAPPPSSWSGERIGAEPGAPSFVDVGGAADVALCGSSWKHIKSISNRDEARTAELFDLLAHSIRETQYSFQPQEWPNLLKLLPPGLSEMPSVVVDRYASRQTVAFCGVFPAIRRAWASVDNTLFLWRFDRWRDAPIEYNGEDQSIVTVGLVTPKPGVFVEAIQHLLVICTTVETLLVGVCSSASVDSSGDGHDDITLQPLPLYSVPVDDEPMVCVTGTADGRIFLGGADGELYELNYNALGSGWHSKPCSKTCHTRGLRRLLPNFLPTFVFGTPSPLVDLVLDEERHILYARTQASHLQVFDLGQDGTSAPSKVAECTDTVAESTRALGGREAFGRVGSDRRGAGIVFLAPVPRSESSRLHLVTLTSDARRVYWSVSPPGGAAGPPRPSHLRAELARVAPPAPLPRAAAAVPGAAVLVASRALEIVSASYASGVLVMADAVPSAAGVRLLALARDFTIPPLGTALGAVVSLPGLRETLIELEGGLAGEPCAVRSTFSPLVLAPPAPTPRDELMSQNAAAAPRFAIVTTTGVAEVERQRPVDVLAALLLARHQRALEHFFRSYGSAEAAAMCVLLACGGDEVVGPANRAPAAAAARAALDDSRLCAETTIRDGPPPGAQSYLGHGGDEFYAPYGGGFDMGGAVPVAEPVWSDVHQGLCLYTARVLHSALWDGPVVQTCSSTSLLRSAMDAEVLHRLESRLGLLSGFIGEVFARKTARRGGQTLSLHADAASGRALLAPDTAQAAKRARLEDAITKESKETVALRALVSRAAQAAFLLRVLSEHNLGRLVASCDPALRATLVRLRFRDWIAGEEGEGVATRLIAALVSEHLTVSGGIADDLAAALASGCPAFFDDSDRVYYRGVGVLQRAQGASSVGESSDLVEEAVSLLRRVPLSCDLGRLTPQLIGLGATTAAVELASARAQALDPAHNALAGSPEGEAARAVRENEAYGPLAEALRALLNPSSAQGTPMESVVRTVGEVAQVKSGLVAVASKSRDQVLHGVVYRELMAAGVTAELLAIDTPFIEPFLILNSGLAGATPGTRLVLSSAQQRKHAETLAKFYIIRSEYGNAAQVFEFLADSVLSIDAPSSVAPTLAQRESLLQTAVLQARSCGDAELVERLEGKARVVDLQARVADALEKSGKQSARAAAADLWISPHALAELYNDFAAPYELWSLCLEAVDLSGFGDEAYVRHLWDLTLKTAWQSGWDATAGNADVPATPDACARTAFESTCAVVVDLGEKFYPNNNSLPFAHIALRLEQVAIGRWPAATGLGVDHPLGAITLVSASRGAYLPALRAYEELLSSRSDTEAQGDELRLLFLREVLWLVGVAQNKLQEQASGFPTRSATAMQRSELAVLIDAATNAASLARTLSTDQGAILATQLGAVVASIVAEQDQRNDVL